MKITQDVRDYAAERRAWPRRRRSKPGWRRSLAEFVIGGAEIYKKGLTPAPGARILDGRATPWQFEQGLRSGPTRSWLRSARAAWERSTGRATRGWGARSRSRCCPESLATDRERLRRFEQEARSASALNHPNIVTIYEIGRQDGVAVIAMELVDGRDAARAARRRGAAAACDSSLEIAAQIAERPREGARRRHRAPRPEARERHGHEGRVRQDPGLRPGEADASRSPATAATPTLAPARDPPGTVLGRSATCRPSRRAGEPLDFRSDQFSLGLDALRDGDGQAGVRPRTAAETLSAIIRDEPVALSESSLPAPFRWIVDAAWRRSRRGVMRRRATSPATSETSGGTCPFRSPDPYPDLRPGGAAVSA